MIRVLNKDGTTRRMICSQCNAELEFESSDIEYKELGIPYLRCPVCGNYVDISDMIEPLRLTINNVKYPDNFYTHTEEISPLDDKDVMSSIKDCISLLLKSKNKSDYAYVSCGNYTVLCTYESYPCEDDKVSIQVFRNVAETVIDVQ